MCCLCCCFKFPDKDTYCRYNTITHIRNCPLHTEGEKCPAVIGSHTESYWIQAGEVSWIQTDNVDEYCKGPVYRNDYCQSKCNKCLCANCERVEKIPITDPINRPVSLPAKSQRV